MIFLFEDAADHGFNLAEEPQDALAGLGPRRREGDAPGTSVLGIGFPGGKATLDQTVHHVRGCRFTEAEAAVELTHGDRAAAAEVCQYDRLRMG